MVKRGGKGGVACAAPVEIVGAGADAGAGARANDMWDTSVEVGGSERAGAGVGVGESAGAFAGLRMYTRDTYYTNPTRA